MPADTSSVEKNIIIDPNVTDIFSSSNFTEVISNGTRIRIERLDVSFDLEDGEDPDDQDDEDDDEGSGRRRKKNCELIFLKVAILKSVAS